MKKLAKNFTKTECIKAVIDARGFTLVKSLTHYTVYQFKNGRFLFVGKGGSFRVGEHYRVSYPVPSKTRENWIDQGRIILSFDTSDLR